MAEKIKVNVDKIRIVRLMSGEELLCQVLKEGKDSITVQLPCIIVPSGGNNLGIAPWMPYADWEDEVVLGEKVVAFITKPHEELAKEYKRAHSDTPEIVVPERKEVVGVIGAP